jgi:hypothetical protein
MPGGDRTGPLGTGPRTGRAAGYCSGSGMPGYANPVPGRGFGMGFGRGRGGWGRGRGFGGGGPRDEKRFLKNEAEALQAELDQIKQRLSEMETTP